MAVWKDRHTMHSQVLKSWKEIAGLRESGRMSPALRWERMLELPVCGRTTGSKRGSAIVALSSEKNDQVTSDYLFVRMGRKSSLTKLFVRVARRPTEAIGRDDRHGALCGIVLHGLLTSVEKSKARLR